MPRFAANLSFLWAELPFLDRFDAAAHAGFRAVEILFPYETPAAEMHEALERNGLEMVLLNAPPPNYTGGPRGYAAVPGGEHRFEHDIRRSLRYAQVLGAKHLHVMSGVAEGKEARETFLSNLRSAAELAPEGLTLTIEPLNAGDMPGYFLKDYRLAAEILTELALPNVGLQYDSYHAQVITGDAIATFEAYRPFIRHIQIGDAPGRCAPGQGTIDFAALFSMIDASGYDGWVSAEYNTSGRTKSTLGWHRALQRAR